MAKDPKDNLEYRMNQSRLNDAKVGNVVVHPTKQHLPERVQHMPVKIAMHHLEREKRSSDAAKVKMDKISEHQKSKGDSNET